MTDLIIFISAMVFVIICSIAFVCCRVQQDRCLIDDNPFDRIDK